MKLTYFDGTNFGDALNPLIFNRYIPNLLDADSSIQFVGIGSLIGLPLLNTPGKKIFFSTGYGKYGIPQQLTAADKVICVRGPLTAKVLGIDDRYAVTDGAALLRDFKFPIKPKIHSFSLMPHWESEYRVAWKSLCAETGIHYISPTGDVEGIIGEVLQTEVLIAEAMHGAIVADTLRTPWIPIKAYHNIKEFKWLDWTLSMNLPFQPTYLPPLFESAKEASYSIEDFSLRDSEALSNKLINRAAGLAIAAYHRHFRKRKVISKLNEIKGIAPFLSKEETLDAKVELLKEHIASFIGEYGKHGK